MNIIFFSDFHNCMDFTGLDTALLSCPSPDVFFTLGDISVRELCYIKELGKTIPIYGISGNHDGGFSLAISGIPNIHGKCIDVNGINFSGFEGSVRYKRGDYTMFTQKESIDVMTNVPQADILISHDRAFCGKKLAISEEYSKSPHEGLAGIFAYLKKYSPALHVHGHIHKNKRYFFNGIDTVSVFGAVYISIENNSINDYRILVEP